MWFRERNFGLELEFWGFGFGFAWIYFVILGIVFFILVFSFIIYKGGISID